MTTDTKRAHASALWIALTAAAACTSETVAAPPAPPVNWHSFDARAVDAGTSAPTDKERALAEAYAAALGSASFAQLAPLVDDEAHFSFPGLDEAHGRDPVVHAHDILFGAFDQRHFAATHVWRTASEQTVAWTMTGVQARDWMRVPASQKPVVIEGVTLLWTKDDGSVADVHLYFDVAAVRAQLGAGPKGLTPFVPPVPPAGPPQFVDQTGKEMDNVGTVRTALDALENSEPMYLNSFTDDIEVHTLERADPARGKDEPRAYYRATHKAIAQLDTTLVNGWSMPNFAVVEYTIAGEQIAPLGWIPLQKDAVIRLHVVDVCEIRDGRIARVWRYDNPSEIVAPGP